MIQQYKALKDVGRWKKGQMIGTLPAAQINQLLTDGVIEAVEPTKPKTTKEVKADV